jgi:diphthamide biosynthesis protein 4
MLVNYYAVLGLPTSPNNASFTEKDIKQAYRQALLANHPDKSEQKHATQPKYTVDEITIAYKILSNAGCRSEHDRILRLQAFSLQQSDAKNLTGLETVDLDDMEYDEATSVWYRSCRCGNERGYQITEEELGKELDHGAIISGCGGCSLWLTVVFQVAEQG